MAETTRTLNETLERGRARALELEGRLVDVVAPILDRAGRRAARNFRTYAVDYLTAGGSLPLVAAAPTPASTMVAVKPRPDEAAALAEEGGEAAETLHVTLALLGETDEADIPAIVDALKTVTANHGPLAGTVGGVGLFDDNGNGHPAILLPDVPGLVELRQAVCEALFAAGIDYSRDHGWTPHLTIRYGDGEPPSDGSVGKPLHFDDLVVARGDVPSPLPLVGVKPVTAAAGTSTQIVRATAKVDQRSRELSTALRGADDDLIATAKQRLKDARKRLFTLSGQLPSPGWAAPMGDQVVDAKGLARALRGKTDPVRLALVEAVAKETVEQAGVAWDISNPYIGRALASTASQIGGIAETTRANVMAIIAEAYDMGLSIPDTARMIQAGMRAATPARAVMIARTEMAGAVSAGSLAAVQIVDSATGGGATGGGHMKSWKTASGARYPRHEDYEDLDGQTVPLDAYFRVGNAELQYPGDPSGDAGEVVNCRCVLVYVEGSGGGE